MAKNGRNYYTKKHDNRRTSNAHGNLTYRLKFDVGDKAHLVFCGAASAIDYRLAMMRCWVDQDVNHTWNFSPHLHQLRELLTDVAGSLVFRTSFLFPHRFDDLHVWWLPWPVETSDTTIGHYCCTYTERRFKHVEVDLAVRNIFHMIQTAHSFGREASQHQKWSCSMLYSL